MYSLFNQTISIFEKGTSSFDSGFLLRNRHVPKPGSSQENPDLYSPADFAIGATVEGIHLLMEHIQCRIISSNVKVKVVISFLFVCSF